MDSDLGPQKEFRSDQTKGVLRVTRTEQNWVEQMDPLKEEWLVLLRE